MCSSNLPGRPAFESSRSLLPRRTPRPCPRDWEIVISNLCSSVQADHNEDEWFSLSASPCAWNNARMFPRSIVYTPEPCYGMVIFFIISISAMELCGVFREFEVWGIFDVFIAVMYSISCYNRPLYNKTRLCILISCSVLKQFLHTVVKCHTCW